MKIKRIRRGCYNKYHRCPGWVGGGFKWPKNEVCDGGSLVRIIDYDSRFWRWKFHYCPLCQTLVLPYYQRYLDPTYLWWRAKFKFETWNDERKWRKSWERDLR